MGATIQTQRRQNLRRSAGSTGISVEVNCSETEGRWVRAEVVDIENGGLGLTMGVAIQPGSRLLVRSREESGAIGQIRAIVQWCVKFAGGRFRLGLAVLKGDAASGTAPRALITSRPQNPKPRNFAAQAYDALVSERTQPQISVVL